jgi:hypothetical protein
MAITTIQISQELRQRLSKLKVHPRQPYEEVIAAALDALEGRPRTKSGEAKDKVDGGALSGLRKRLGWGPTDEKPGPPKPNP